MSLDSGKWEQTQGGCAHCPRWPSGDAADLGLEPESLRLQGLNHYVVMVMVEGNIVLILGKKKQRIGEVGQRPKPRSS